MAWRTWLGGHRRWLFAIGAVVALAGLLVFATRGGDEARARVQAAGASTQSSSEPTTTVTLPALSTSTVPSSDASSPPTIDAPTSTHPVTASIPPTTSPPVTAPPTTSPPTTQPVPAGYARIEIANGLNRTVVVHLDSVGAIDATLNAGQSRGATNMAVTDDHADAGSVAPPGEMCGSRGIGDYFSDGHRYRVTVTTWNGSAEGGACASEPTPMLVVTDLDTGATKTIG